MTRMKRLLSGLKRKTRRVTQEEKYLASSDSLAMLEHRQKNIQLGLAPYQKYSATKYFI